MHKNVTIKYEDEITQEDYDQAEPDIVMALGGDRTFLAASGCIPDANVPLFGVKTLSSSIGNLQYNEVDFKRREKQIPLLLEALDDDSVTNTYTRSRALFESTH